MLCLPGSISVRVMKIYYEEKGIGLDQLHFSDFSCKGVVDPRNPEVWVFNLTTLSSCSTIHVVRDKAEFVNRGGLEGILQLWLK